MYAALWRMLPGPVWLRVILAAAARRGSRLRPLHLGLPWVDGIVNPIEVTVET